MSGQKNLLITTLGYTANQLHVEYYAGTTQDGELRFCTGISGAEAGVKFLLSRYAIDEILVLGPADAAGSAADLTPRQLDTFSLSGIADLGGCSEFDFFCYRIQQYLEHLDIEAHDILYYASSEKRSQLRSFLRKEIAKGPDGQFYLAATDEAAYARFRDAVEKLETEEETRWLKHMMYHEMDSFFKLRALRSNRTVSVRFLPMEKQENGSFSVAGMADIVDSLVTRYRDGVQIYVDLQGMDKADSYTMNSMLSLAYSAKQNFRIKSMIHTRTVPNSFVNHIYDEIRRYDFETLLTGMRAFTKYGKSELLEEYCSSHEIRDPSVTDMLKAMRYVDTGVSLCNLEDLKYGIQALKKNLRRDRDSADSTPGAAVFSILKRGIRQDYGPLLEGEEVSIPELIGWALRKHFYQQALTMIESLVPTDLVRRGICYYAKTAADKEDVLSRWNVLYWNEIPKCRFVFKNPDHYFLKSYGRSAINNAQAPQAVSQDLAKTMVAQLHSAKPELCRIYSSLKDTDLLYDLLLNYYNIGHLRNRVSHANSTEKALDRQEELQSNTSFELLKQDIAKFLRIYRAACEAAAASDAVPLQITDTEFRYYTRQHRLQPLSCVSPEQLLENTCQCQFNGQDVSITIRMLRPMCEEDL